MGILIAKILMGACELLGEYGIGAGAKLVTYKVLLFGGKAIIVTVKVVGGAIVGIVAAHEIFGF